MHGGLEDIALSLSSLVESRPLPPPPRPVVIPASDDETSNEGEAGFAEGQSFMIDYVDSAGRPSRRRITAHKIGVSSSGIPCITAQCHERNALRTFRVDRIVCCIDYDGVVHDDVPKFLADNFGTAFAVATRRPPPDVERSEKILNTVWADSVFLAAMMRADQRVRAIEMETAADYLAQAVERSGLMLTPEEIARLGQRLKRQRPSIQTIMRAIAAMQEYGPERIKRTLIAAARVMECDGERHPREAALLNALAVELLGISLF